MRIFVNIKPHMQAVQHNPSIIQKAEERQWVQQPGHCCEVIENKKQIQKRKKKTPQHFLLSCSQTFKAFLTESLAPLPSYKDGRYCTIDPISHLLRLSCYHKCRYVFQNVCTFEKKRRKKEADLNQTMTARVWKAVWQRVHTEKKCKILHECRWCWWCKGCSCPTSVTDWHGPLIFYGLGVKWGNSGYRKEGR